MRNLIKLFLLAVTVSFFYTACDKADKLPFYDKGTAVQLSGSKTTVAAAAADSNNVAIVFNWTTPNYATDSSHYKYVVEMDSSGRNFSKKVTKTIATSRTASYTAKELNAILLAYGFAYNTPYDMDVRVISSYANNNEQYTSNVLKIKMTPYVTPPKVTPPTTNHLFIVGNATPGVWANPVPVPSQELVRMDSVTYGAILNLPGGGEYLLLPVNTNTWNAKYGVADKFLAGLSAGGDFGFHLDPANVFNDNFPGPTAAGWYKMVFNFQSGKFTVAPFANAAPQELYITGDAVASNWVNNPPAAQKFTRLNNGEFEITVALIPGKNYKFLSSFNNWQPQFGGTSVTGGTLGANYGSSNDPDAIPSPAAAGNYKIHVNFLTNTYKVTQ
jgi:hypothetical protein